MLYGILAGNKVHLSEIALSLKENITLKKTIERLSRNLNSFDEKQFELEDLRVMSLQSIRNLNLFEHFKIADAGAFVFEK